MSAHNTSFRFLDLPGEIRNQIYHEVLCRFWKSEPVWRNTDTLQRILCQELESNGVNELAHQLTPALLRTCKQIHREAYDVIVKTNRFIRVQVYNSTFWRVLNDKQVPIVNMDRQKTDQFKGYVMEAVIRCKHEYSLDEEEAYFSLMMLAQDWEELCRNLHTCFRDAEVNFELSFNSKTEWGQSDTKAPLSDFLTSELIATLLDPLDFEIRNIKQLTITVPPSLQPALATKIANLTQLTTTPWDINRTLANMRSMRQSATKLYEEGHTLAASTLFHTTMEYGQSWLPSPRMSRDGYMYIIREIHDLNFCMAKCFDRYLHPEHLARLGPAAVVELAQTTIWYMQYAREDPGHPERPMVRLMLCRATRVLAGALGDVRVDLVDDVGEWLLGDARNAEGWEAEMELWRKWKAAEEARQATE